MPVPDFTGTCVAHIFDVVNVSPMDYNFFVGERVFPPQAGLTYSTWFCVDKFSSMNQDPHPVRLFTIVRNLQGREENLICLSIILSPKDKNLYVCTQESLMPTTGKHGQCYVTK